MKTLDKVGLALALLAASCGQQLVQFGDEGLGGGAGRTGGGAGAGGLMGMGGVAGAGGAGGRSGPGGAAGASGVGGLPGVIDDAGVCINDAGLDGGPCGDSSPPNVLVTNPEDDDENVAINKTILATFDEGMAALTINEDTFLVTGPGADPVGEVAYDPGTNTASFNPTGNLAPNTLYSAVLLTGVTDVAGNAMQDPFIWTFTTGTNEAQEAAQAGIELGEAFTFAILGSAAVTDSPPADITGDVGLHPAAGTGITGFICSEVTGTIYTATDTGPACRNFDEPLLAAAKLAALDAFDDAQQVARGVAVLSSENLAGITLYPGLYDAPVSLQIAAGGDLVLDAQGDANAVFILRSPSTITIVTGANVILSKGAQAQNVYFTAGSSITIGQDATMVGTLIAGTAITFDPGATLIGRALTQGTLAQAITLEANVTITVPNL